MTLNVKDGPRLRTWSVARCSLLNKDIHLLKPPAKLIYYYSILNVVMPSVVIVIVMAPLKEKELNEIERYDFN